MDWRTLLSDQKQIIAAVIAGLLAIVAAYIRRDHRGETHTSGTPVLGLLLFPLFYLLLGASLLYFEFYYWNVKPGGDLSLSNPGAILCLAGCVFVVAGVVWFPINLIRLVLWPRPPLTPAPQPLAPDQGKPATPAGSATPKRKPSCAKEP